MIGQQEPDFLVDKMSMCNYSLDTIFNLIPNIEDFDKIYIEVTSNFVKYINSDFAGYKAIATSSKRIPRAAKDEEYLNLMVDFYPKESKECIVRIKTYKHERKNKSLYGYGMYMLIYHLDDEEGRYSLTEIIQGIEL